MEILFVILGFLTIVCLMAGIICQVVRLMEDIDENDHFVSVFRNIRDGRNLHNGGFTK